jgi:uncharacterized protein
MKIDATWDPAKALANEKKHDGVRFSEAATVLADPLALTVFDVNHSDDEERWFTLGRSAEGTLLAVSHTFEEPSSGALSQATADADPDVVPVRIISARLATRRERVQYEEAAR